VMHASESIRNRLFDAASRITSASRSSESAKIALRIPISSSYLSENSSKLAATKTCYTFLECRIIRPWMPSSHG
jgi:hypothetical protein